MHHRSAWIVVLIALLFYPLTAALGAPAQEVVENQIFRLEIPKDWKIESWGPPIKVRGPNTEIMLISVVMPDPKSAEAGNMAESKQMEQFWREQIHQAIVSAVSQDGMKITEPFNETAVNGRPFFNAKSRNKKQGSFLGSYGLIGYGGTVFIVTVEGWLKNEIAAETATESMLKSMVWKRRS